MPLKNQTQTANWTETASATNATATATHAAESGNWHFLSGVLAGFTGSGNTANLAIKDGSTTIISVTVHDDIYLTFDTPIRISQGSKVEATLSAGGSGVDGEVNILGFTESAGS